MQELLLQILQVTLAEVPELLQASPDMIPMTSVKVQLIFIIQMQEQERQLVQVATYHITAQQVLCLIQPQLCMQTLTPEVQLV